MKKDEKILAVSRKVIFQNGHWQGLKTENLDYYLDLIKDNFEIKLRNEIEADTSWKQIIPYIVFSFGNKYFLYHYLEKSADSRLRNDYILGIGGHINPEDISENDIIETATMREWSEEVEYKGTFKKKSLIGIVNDEGREIESCHLGLVYHFEGDSPEIFVKEKEILEGRLIELKNLWSYLKNIHGWAPIVYKEYLVKFLK